MALIPGRPPQVLGNRGNLPRAGPLVAYVFPRRSSGRRPVCFHRAHGVFRSRVLPDHDMTFEPRIPRSGRCGLMSRRISRCSIAGSIMSGNSRLACSP